jgi:hypothetical protein
MPRKALTDEERKAKKRENNRRYFQNAGALARKREIDRLKKRERRQQSQIGAQDRLSPLRDAAVQQEILLEQEEDEEPKEGRSEGEREARQIEDEGGPIEYEDGAILEGFYVDNWNMEQNDDRGTATNCLKILI